MGRAPPEKDQIDGNRFARGRIEALFIDPGGIDLVALAAPLGAERCGDGARRQVEQIATEHHIAHEKRRFAGVDRIDADVVDQCRRVGRGVKGVEGLGATRSAPARQRRLQARTESCRAG